MSQEKALRKSLAEKYIQLGEIMHVRIRNRIETDASLISISNQIALIEREIYELAHQGMPSKEQGICPQCSNPYGEEAQFCGSCGLNIKVFYEQNTNYCGTCGGLIVNQKTYCGICGNKSDY